MGEIRRFFFTLEEAKSKTGVAKLIGRASKHDPERLPRKNNLLFQEKSLSKNHAILGLKLLDPLEPGIHIIDQFRIYIKDLGSTYGIVDLNSQESDPFVVDLKNGERFGLINLDSPTDSRQRRAAKLKFKVNIQYRDPKKGIFECLVEDVSEEASPLVSRPSTYDDDVRIYGLMPSNVETYSMVSSSSSPSEWDFDEDDILFEDDTSADESGYDLGSFVYTDPSDDESEGSNDQEKEGYTVVNLISISELADDWDIWKTEELNKRQEIARGLRDSTYEKDLLDEDDEVILSDSGKTTPPHDFPYVKHLIICGLLGFTFGVFGSFGILAVLANKME